jgi:hypothetical protein
MSKTRRNLSPFFRGLPKWVGVSTGGRELVVTASNHCSGWRAAVDEGGHYSFAVAL